MHFLARDLAEPPEPPPLPDGFRYRTVEPATSRSASQSTATSGRRRASPSRATRSVRGRVAVPRSLDCVVEAPDGRFAAYCLIWPDDENRVGELEPVGVREEFRRRGLGAAVCTFALQRLHEEGGRQAIVYCVGTTPKRSAPLYESIGFRRHATLIGYSR